MWGRAVPLALLAYSIGAFILSVTAEGSAAAHLLTLTFCVIVPGYSLTATLFPHIVGHEKAAVSVGLSLALLVGVKSLGLIAGLESSISELIVLELLSIGLLTSKVLSNGPFRTSVAARPSPGSGPPSS